MDEVFRSRLHYQPHTGEMTHQLNDTTEDIVLERNAELRKNPGSLHDLGAQGNGGTWGRKLADIPPGLILWAKNNGMDLFHPDKDQCQRNLAAFLATPQGRACLVQDVKRGSKSHGG